ncbi:glycolate oxidase iron-sulfur subunit [Novosphingobium endophyticum]|uniref:Glycolate oxidase iron-sulfur subunit n=1 Tax=Novosphingobium endophyticum TaxID=1955250 RepID=A0A916X716_9SPHN|nr:glycolate oxidase subunit GlcF [Novosphingobium endophyticum]GGC13470.1 glycolate oxidase iron-sulfur subunit [Novosphingobium endophyticum]
MQTRFTPEQLLDPATATSEAVIRKCVHCGFCTATCPTYVLLGDELDSPRGRIYLIKEMLENEQEPSAEVVKHIDRCLSCLSCMTTCPSGVNYMHLVDHARAYIEERYRRPVHERLIRWTLAQTLPYPRRMRLALRLARLARWMEPAFARTSATRPLAAMLRLAPSRLPAPGKTESALAEAARRGRVILLQGCAENVLRPEIRAATVRLLTRAGYDVQFAPGEGCCGALTWHLGREQDGLSSARRNVDVWRSELEKGLDAIVITASGCGTTIKDYGHMLREDPAYAEDAARLSALAMDVTELLARDGLPAAADGPQLDVAYLSPCSMQHGQQIRKEPVQLLEAAGYRVRQPAEAHLCCGSAGTYNILQPEIAGQLGDRKAANLERLSPSVIATGNIGCATQIASRVDVPVVHTVELLDWATGGPIPEALDSQIAKQET